MKGTHHVNRIDEDIKLERQNPKKLTFCQCICATAVIVVLFFTLLVSCLLAYLVNSGHQNFLNLENQFIQLRKNFKALETKRSRFKNSIIDVEKEISELSRIIQQKVDKEKLSNAKLEFKKLLSDQEAVFTAQILAVQNTQDDKSTNLSYHCLNNTATVYKNS